MTKYQGMNRKGSEVATWAYQYQYLYKGTDMEFWAEKAVQAVYSLRKSYGRLASMKKNQFILDVFVTGLAPVWIETQPLSLSQPQPLVTGLAPVWIETDACRTQSLRHPCHRPRAGVD